MRRYLTRQTAGGNFQNRAGVMPQQRTRTGQIAARRPIKFVCSFGAIEVLRRPLPGVEVTREELTTDGVGCRGTGFQAGGESLEAL